MKKYLLTVLVALLFFKGYGQFQIKEGIYTSFDGRKIDVYLIEGAYSVLNIDKKEITSNQLLDILTLKKILTRTDDLYAFYKDNLGFEPPGGNPIYGNKVNVFFGAPSCGSGCGLVGAKGIEVGGFSNIFFNLKYDLNVNRDVILGYEFGRNFFTFSNKILFPFTPNTDEKNGGFAEGFANLMYLYAFDKIMTNPSQRELNETLLNIRWGMQQFRGYVNDDSANPYNSLAKWEKSGTLDPNRGIDGWNYDTSPAYPGSSILIGIFETLDKGKMFPKFFEILRTRPSVNKIEDALSNIAYSASFALNRNLLPFFINVLKFNINPDVEAQIKVLPVFENKLIRDEPLLWFVSPFEKITLNLKSTNYLNDNCTYQILVDGKVYSTNKDGKNSIDYKTLENMNEKILNCQLISNGVLIDNYNVKIKKRHNFNVFDFKQDFYANYLSNDKSLSLFKNDTLTIKSLEKTEPVYGLIYYNFVFSRDRKYKLEGEVLNISRKYNSNDPLIDGLPSSGWTSIGFGGPGRSNGFGRFGYDIGVGDTLNFLKSGFTDYSNLFMPSDRQYFMNRVYISNVGYGEKTKVKNLYFYDITDTDGDGFIDFEDNCPDVYGIYKGCPQIPTSKTEINSNELKIFPNPTSNKLNIKTTGINGEIAIFDILGNRIVHQKIINNNTEIDVSQFSQGTYLVHVISNNRTQTSKFVKM